MNPVGQRPDDGQIELLWVVLRGFLEMNNHLVTWLLVITPHSGVCKTNNNDGFVANRDLPVQLMMVMMMICAINEMAGFISSIY